MMSTTLNHALAEDADERWKWVLDRYLDQRSSLSKVAELLGMHALELRERFLQLGIPLRIGPADLAEAKAEVESIC
jgi:predicted HTH domain antitoxin